VLSCAIAAVANSMSINKAGTARLKSDVSRFIMFDFK
jgi:hypothetical protein